MSSISLPSPVPSNDPSETILRAALVEFSEMGFALTSMRSVARRAGVSLHLVRRHFSDKHELFRDMVRWTLIQSVAGPDAMLAAVTAADPSDSTPAADGADGADVATVADLRDAAHQVGRFARRYWSAMERPEMLALVRLTIAELPRFPELAVFHAAESFERLLHELERIITGGVQRGELHTADVRAAARTVLATLAAHAIWFAYPDVYGALTGPDRSAAASATIESLLRSLGASPPSTGGVP